MEWHGQPTKPSKYVKSTWDGKPIVSVGIVKAARFNDDGELIEETFVNLYAENNIPLELCISASNLEPYALADYILCDIQNEDKINVTKG